MDKKNVTGSEQEDRRAFLKRAGTVAKAAPAAALLLSASLKPTQAVAASLVPSDD